MEVTSFVVYLVDIVDKLVSISGLVSLLLFLLALFLLYVSIDEDADGEIRRDAKGLLKKLVLPVLVIFFLAYLLVPRPKTLAAMYVIPAVANNEQIQNISKNGLDSLELLTKQWVEELREEASGKDK